MPNKGVATDGIGFIKPDGNFEYVDADNPLPVEIVSGGGGGGGTSFNGQLTQGGSDVSNANPLPVGGSVTPAMTSGGNISATTNATGTNWTAYGSQACKQLTLSNQSGTTIEVRQGGAGVGLQIPTGAFYTFFGITNANQLEVRRVDTSNTQVTITARWEA